MTSPFPDPRATRRAAVAVAALAALVAAALSGAIARRPDAAGAQPAEAFAWRDLGTLPQNLYHRAAAFDAVGHALVLYGGLDVNDTARANIDVVDLADPDLGKAVMRPNLRPLGPVAQLWGAAAAARNIGGRREIVFTGGADAAGNPYDLVQIYDLAANTWTSNRPTGRFDRRVLHGAVFDPGGDQVIVHGGSERCELFPAAGPAICLDPYATTQFLVFDNQSGGLTWVNGPSGPRVYGHSMVWDPLGRRVVLYGGTYDGTRGSGDVWALDMSQGREMASWSRLEVAAGPAPDARALHGAAWDPGRRWMVVYGGATRTIYRTGEVVATQETWALDFKVAPPAWRLLGAPVGDRIGHALVFDPNHAAALLYGGRGKLRSGRQTVASDVQALLGAPPVAPTASPTPRPTATPLVPLVPQACPFITGRVPTAAIADALANPRKVNGFGEPANPSLPPGAGNPPKLFLTMLNPSVPWNPFFNSLVYKAGCP